VDRTTTHDLAGELATVEKRLRRAERLDSLGRLAGGIAHDFNNLLAAIIGLGELIQDRVDAETRSDVRTLLDTAERGAALTQRLLAFARREEVKPVPFEIGELLEGLHRMLDRLLGSRTNLAMTVDRKLPAVFVDPSQLEQIIVNLVINADEAMREGGTLSLRARLASETDWAGFRMLPQPEASPMVLLEVEDEGVGIAPAYRELIFEPFVSSKDEGSGSGLGLATVQSLVTQAGGHIRVSSEEGVGTTFSILLPTSTEAPESLTPPSAPPRKDPRRGRVLLVEDDRLLQRVLGRSLRKSGFDVLTASDGREALALMDDPGGESIDILVTDVVMPHLSGVELAMTLRKRWPALPVILCSGHHTETLSDATLAPPLASLGKPVPHLMLVETIQRLLDG